MSVAEVANLSLPALPEGWTGGDKGFKVIATLSSATQRNVEPVGPHFLAHARRVSFVLVFLNVVIL
jgi:DnaJ family protein C protein 2